MEHTGCHYCNNWLLMQNNGMKGGNPTILGELQREDQRHDAGHGGEPARGVGGHHDVRVVAQGVAAQVAFVKKQRLGHQDITS
jgi:hypothetical protein